MLQGNADIINVALFPKLLAKDLVQKMNTVLGSWIVLTPPLDSCYPFKLGGLRLKPVASSELFSYLFKVLPSQS